MASHTGLCRWLVFFSALLTIACSPPVFSEDEPPTWKIYYISPTGSDWSNGKSADKPFKTFAHAFDKMSGGDELILLDGVYSEPAGTGYISYTDYDEGIGGSRSGQIPSGVNSERKTYVHALNPGKVTVVGVLFIGRSSRKDSHIKIQGITFEGGGSLFNTSHVTIKDCGFHGGFSIGTNDHPHGNEHNLIEDVWIWASGERIIAINYRSRFNVWRRVLVRGDGCDKKFCRGESNPNVGITVYDSSSVSLQNVMVVDRILAPGDEPYADFAVAQHTRGAHLFGQSEWLGTISLRAPDTGYYMEPDHEGVVDPTIHISNAVAWDAAHLGFNLSRAGTNNELENLTVRALGGDGVRIAPALTSGSLRNVISVDAPRNGINSRYPFSHVNVYNAGQGAYRQNDCATGCFSSDPRADGKIPSLKYLVRIEPGSKLKGSGYRGGDIGANVLYRYGVDGSRYGNPDFNKLTTVPLWPWPNEERIKKEMCEKTGVARGFCKARSLTHYIWEYMGNPMPAAPYAPAETKQSSSSVRGGLISTTP
ncbi:MAG: hypothetical protein NUV55_04890 [Sulfuricaulis sp.]|uniref:hypothetical protein n=1 Tax=Sulfuricaulis sp. TaxID=2003553 RepID=UPI0025E7E7EC|nr:hypothetical protein [Sulfuricaulis sp.]MCR4346524.1 hypothetical protein [Sulfuricaulis sp.]